MRLLTKASNPRGKLIWGLLFLRIPFPYLTIAFQLTPSLRGRGLGAAIYLVSTSCLIAALIYVEREQLSEFNVDPIFLWMFALGKPIELAIIVAGLGAPSSVIPIYISYLFASLATLWVIRKLAATRGFQYKRSLPGIAAGIVVGFVCSIVSGFIIAQQDLLLGVERLETAASFAAVLRVIVYQSAMAGLIMR